MAYTFMRAATLGLFGACAAVTAVQAGGFARGEADTEILYEDGSVAARGGIIYVIPKRGYATINGATGTDDDYSKNYAIPSFSAKARISENLSCAFTYTQPFGAKSEYGTQAQTADRAADALPPLLVALGVTGNAVIKSKFDTNEYGGTCAVNFDVGPGQMYFIGGGFVESFDYTEVKDFGSLNLKDSSAGGYRVGAAYTIPEYALRAELLYRSQVDHDVSGIFRPSAAITSVLGGLGIAVPSQMSATGSGSLPQSLELNLQSGIAPGWLAFGSVKWTDWSVLQTLNYSIPAIAVVTGGALPANQQKNFFWKDGWTISGGVGHSFNDNVSGAVTLTWDKGVGTGADIMSDVWTLGLGSQIKGGPGVLRVGAGLSYLTSGSQSKAKGADFDATANGDWAYALTASYKIAF
ncbi:outer membrane protein transport protein [Rhizobium sp. Leaf262]|uniref:outer membrane protein transport protein n=1 Tax=Rhizobium sp. Leaf262 TaxID=1736312 RepID=UPI000714C9E3|nr:outer membrane protein transport protein [Rhizobium sp. Leaf262]KQO81203.1 long-chain fatty acid transporter [Rhizobium sp. Leaf262]